MLTVVIGLASALVYGTADFFGGLAAKRIGAVLATAVAAAAGLGLILVLLPFVGGVWSRDALVLGAISGVTGAIAIGLLYACLAIGPMSILSPLTAVVSAIVPMLVGLTRGESVGVLGAVALGIALVAVVLVGFVPERGAVRPSLRGVLMAIGSGLAIGAFLVILDAAPEDSGLVPLVANRAVNSLVMFSIVLVTVLIARRRGQPTRPHADLVAGVRLAIVCGVFDAVANVGLLWGIRIGDLSVMAVLTALYPAGTIILARLVLKERIAPVQYVGLALALAASAMLALG
jgi:drug/metabolite transporter (DMT)-like permease